MQLKQMFVFREIQVWWKGPELGKVPDRLPAAESDRCPACLAGDGELSLSLSQAATANGDSFQMVYFQGLSEARCRLYQRHVFVLKQQFSEFYEAYIVILVSHVAPVLANSARVRQVSGGGGFREISLLYQNI